MSIFLNNGLSGLLAAQRALTTTSNNVANAGTDGYARQRVMFAENPAQSIGGGLSVGSGVTVAGIDRVFDQFLADELKNATMSEGRANAFSNLATRLDSLLGNLDLGVNQSIQRFFDQAEALSRDPTSSVNRQQLLTEGEFLVQRFGQLDAQLDRINEEVDGRLRETVNTINTLASSLAQVNDRIAASSSNNPNALLDQQDRLLSELAAQIDFTAVRQGNGTVNVLIGNGQPLVLGVNSFELSLVPNEFDGSRLELGYQSGNQLQIISSKIAGGAVAGLLAFRSEALDSARRAVGQLALGLTESFNAQHVQGLDLNGELGTAFFASLSPVATASGNNSGTAAVTLTFADASAVEARDYLLRYNGSAWELFDSSTGAPVALTGSGTGADPFLAAGLEFTVSGAAAAGDRFLLRPVAQATNGMDMLISDPAKIAAAGPLLSGVSLQNISSAAISAVTVADSTDPNLLQDAQIVFDDATTYRILDGGGTDLTGPLAYTDGADISFNGWTVRVSGAPAGGDRFTVGATGAGSGDNSNALALSELPGNGFFGNGQVSLTDVGASMIANVGSTAARASADLAVQSALRQQAELDVESVSGVNLEEEAVNMLRYQEAYLAASKIITVANDLFQSLLNAVR
jgi:flagellar hook-associated protein 1 FlgK